ncbi:MAG: T9SS type A sorting domain-containing protein [Crocinitomix sp.]|nr:T9SS type A sorting domain-containing protein [Crocinitomix sp.]
MKSTLLLLALIPTITFSQWFEEYPYSTYLDFDTDLNLEYIYPDTIANPDNLWQIATPNKTVFTAASSSPNVIITDSTSSYPINDTSSFILMHEIATGFDYGSGLHGNYFVDSDEGNDFGKIEFSPNNGESWVLISDDTLVGVDWDGEPYNWPIEMYDEGPGGTDSVFFTGESGEWKFFNIDLSGGHEFFDWEAGDTVLFRFSFISDSVFDDKDGLMFDDLVLHDYLVFGIDEENPVALTIYPNPTADIIYIDAPNSEIRRVEVYDIQGKRIYASSAELNQVDVSSFPSGNYHLKVYTQQGAAVKSFVKE